MNKKLLIIKLGAAGDVVRTTTLLRKFYNWEITWVIDDKFIELIEVGLVKSIVTKIEELNKKRYDLVLNLEDDYKVSKAILDIIEYEKIFGAYIQGDKLVYTDDSAAWFDLGMISQHGIDTANKLKLSNRKSYQNILFDGLGFRFNSEKYVLPNRLPESTLYGDIAIAPFSGQTWPSKNWYYYNELIELLNPHFKVNVLQKRESLLEHIADIKNHKIVICNDSLPMHLAIGLGIRCFALFMCTSPWEIYDYGLLTKIVSPLLPKYFYSREYSIELVTSISPNDVFEMIKNVPISN